MSLSPVFRIPLSLLHNQAYPGSNRQLFSVAIPYFYPIFIVLHIQYESEQLYFGQNVPIPKMTDDVHSMYNI